MTKYLFWDQDNFLDDQNKRFRQTFSLVPKAFGENFGVFFLAYFTLKAHFKQQSEILGTFKQNALWLVFIALFGAFPFAGGLGIVLGFLCCFTAAIGLILHVKKSSGSATLGLTLDNTRPIGKCGNVTLPEWVFKVWKMALVLVLCLTIINNITHILKNEFHHWCKEDSSENCIGPYLIWPEDFVKSVNADKWGSVFSLDINRGLELWTPTLLVLWYIVFGGYSWFHNAIFLILLALFGAFGFDGNAGIVLGVMLLVASAFSFLIANLGGHDVHQAPGGGYSLMGGSDA